MIPSIDDHAVPAGTRRVLGVVGLIASGVLAASCSSGQPSAASHGRRRTSKTTARPTAGGSTTTTTGTPASTVPTTTTSAAVSAKSCSSGVLSLREGASATAAGTSHITFVLRNEGPSPCALDGYPSVALFGASGAGGAGAGTALTLQDIHLGGAPAPVTIASGKSAAFVLSVADVPVDGVGCRPVASVEATPPGGGGALSGPAAFQACGATVGVYALTASP